MRPGVAFSALPGAKKAVEAVSYWQSYFSLVGAKRIDEEMVQLVRLVCLVQLV